MGTGRRRTGRMGTGRMRTGRMRTGWMGSRRWATGVGCGWTWVRVRPRRPPPKIHHLPLGLVVIGGDVVGHRRVWHEQKDGEKRAIA